MSMQPEEMQQAQQTIEEQRERAGPKIAELRGRLLHDIEEAQQAAKRQASRLSQRTRQIIGVVSGAAFISLITALVVGRMRERRLQQRRSPAYWWEQVRGQAPVWVAEVRKQAPRWYEDVRKEAPKWAEEARHRFDDGLEEAQHRWHDLQKEMRKTQKEVEKEFRKRQKQAQKEMAKRR